MCFQDGRESRTRYDLYITGMRNDDVDRVKVYILSGSVLGKARERMYTVAATTK